MDAFAYAGFDYRTDSLNDESVTLYRYMNSFNKSSSTENKLTGLASTYLFFLLFFFNAFYYVRLFNSPIHSHLTGLRGNM